MRKEGKRKALAALVCGSMLTVALVGGTLAYLTDSDSDVNVMTLGNVSIEQHEYQRVVNEDGTYKTTDAFDNTTSYVLEDFTQGKALLPIVGDPNEPGDSPAYAGWDSIPVRMSQVDSYGGMKVFAGKNAQDKFVTVENTGKTDAYVRTIIAFEIGSTDGSLIGQSYQDSAWTRTAVGNIVIDGNAYRVFEYNYPGARLSDGTYRHENGVLPAGETTYPSLCQFYMKHNATNEDVEAIDGNKNGAYDILVLSQAVQAEGFEDAQTALDTAFGKTSEKAVEWFGEMEKPAVVDTAEELRESLNAGNDIVLLDDVEVAADDSNSYGKTGLNVKNGQVIDGAGSTLSVPTANAKWDSAINTTGGTIKNLTIDAGFRGIFINHNSTHSEPVVLENVIVDGPTYTISCDQGTNQGLTATNSVFNGWTSYAATLGKAEFYNCSFGSGAGYNFSRPYAPTEYVNCDFAEGHQVDPRAAVTFENCTLDGVPLTSENLATLVTSNFGNASVK